MRGQPTNSSITVAIESADAPAFVILNRSDYGLLRYTWHLHRSRDGVYVARRATIGDGQRRVFLHREVLGLAPDDPRRVDHINGNTLDNRRANLRIATPAQNAQNQGSRGGSSRYRGVTWDKARRKWMASATLNGRRHTIGRFDSEDEAGEAAAAWRRKHMPFSFIDTSKAKEDE